VDNDTRYSRNPIKGLIGDRVYGTSTLPALNGSAPAKGVLLALDGNTMDLVVQMGPTVEVVAQDSNGDYVFKVYERFALRLKDKNAVVELDFVPKENAEPGEKIGGGGEPG